MTAGVGFRWDEADRLFDQALELPPAERERWLDRTLRTTPRFGARCSTCFGPTRPPSASSSWTAGGSPRRSSSQPPSNRATD